MFAGADEGRVCALGFKSIEGDEQQHSNQKRRPRKNVKSSRGSPSMPTNTSSRVEQLNEGVARAYCPAEYSCPAVILEDLCFSVDKSQQQSNFLNECLSRLQQCMSPLRRESGDQKVQILKSVNLSVPHGTIFGLLGPSSCGKTTLLRCLLGLLEPSSGAIRLFGCSSFNKPAAGQKRGAPSCSRLCPAGRDQTEDSELPAASRSDCKVPGANVGYMPQDLGLYEDFTIAQLLTMFGNYMRMDSDLIEARVKFMADFLELPDIGRQIQTLSGGQKRRVSFAIACLHMPPLIILDEPTVGVDPLLRQSIWKYLRRLASEENKTIIITTHYIEEAAQADQVALMRAGEILVQDSPGRIIESNNSQTLEEAFLKICNNVQTDTSPKLQSSSQKLKITARPKFQWPAEPEDSAGEESVCPAEQPEVALENHQSRDAVHGEESVIEKLKLKAQLKLAIYDELNCSRQHPQQDESVIHARLRSAPNDNLCLAPDALGHRPSQPNVMAYTNGFIGKDGSHLETDGKTRGSNLFKKKKFVLNDGARRCRRADSFVEAPGCSQMSKKPNRRIDANAWPESWSVRASKNVSLFWALLYKNYRRNVNSIPLLAFQFMLPMIQMISFSLCVGGRPTNVGLGVVNRDNPINFLTSPTLSEPGVFSEGELLANRTILDDLYLNEQNDSLSLRYLSFIDTSMMDMKLYDNLDSALADVRRAKLWAVLEIGENFTVSIAKRFDLENFYQLDVPTIHQSVIKLYPDRSNKILDMICQRSLVDSYRKFLSDEFEHFKRLPVEIARPIFDIKPNVISNSIDGYTESIAPGLLASLTYIMAAGLTTFIMVVERSAGILERTYTSGINPVSYLLAHALFRSLVMMLQIGFVLALTFYVLKQPLVGSIWLAYAMLMTLNVTGISYGLLISSIVTDQNGAALTIVSSLVVKITLSGILWPFEAIPRWLRTICYIQPLTMPVQALKAITLKGAGLGDRAVTLGFLVSITWLLVFLTISSKRFKFYQH